jgi:hypothetical protein
MSVIINKSAIVKFREVSQRKLKELPKIVSDEATIIIDRTGKGIDAEGATFAPYVPKYEKIRGDLGFNTSPPDLRRTGNMLSSIRLKNTKITETSGYTEIAFGSQIEIDKARGNMRKRNFFQLSDEQIQRIKRRLQEA